MDDYSPLPFRESLGASKNPTPTVIHKEDDSGPPEIPADEIYFDEDRDFLGEGAFGRVYAGNRMFCINSKGDAEEKP